MLPSLYHPVISIHAPREGGDVAEGDEIPFTKIFQSTPPARGATVGIPNANTDKKISIHAPREGGDRHF